MENNGLADWFQVPRAPEEFYVQLRRNVARVRIILGLVGGIVGTLLGFVLIDSWPNGRPFPPSLTIPVFLLGFVVMGVAVWLIERYRVSPTIDAWNMGVQVESVRASGDTLQLRGPGLAWRVRLASVAQVQVPLPGWTALRVRHPKKANRFALFVAPSPWVNQVVPPRRSPDPGSLKVKGP